MHRRPRAGTAPRCRSTSGSSRRSSLRSIGNETSQLDHVERDQPDHRQGARRSSTKQLRVVRGQSPARPAVRRATLSALVRVAGPRRRGSASPGAGPAATEGIIPPAASARCPPKPGAGRARAPAGRSGSRACGSVGSVTGVGTLPPRAPQRPGQRARAAGGRETGREGDEEREPDEHRLRPGPLISEGPARGRPARAVPAAGGRGGGPRALRFVAQVLAQRRR